MSFEFPLVFFTVLTQLGAGMAIFLCWNLYTQPESLAGDVQKRAWIWITLATGCGLIFSLFHLGHPFSAYKALYNLGASWLSWEGLGFACFFVLSFINIFCSSRILTLLAALTGAFGLFSQGMTYAPPSIPALPNILPMAIFWLSALAMGGCGVSLLVQGKYENAARYAMLALIVLLLAGPAIWISGSTTMRESAPLWLESPWLWTGIFLVAFALARTWLRAKENLKWQLLTLVIGIFCTRMVFFADTVHTAANIGLPFS